MEFSPSAWSPLSSSFVLWLPSRGPGLSALVIVCTLFPLCSHSSAFLPSPLLLYPNPFIAERKACFPWVRTNLWLPPMPLWSCLASSLQRFCLLLALVLGWVGLSEAYFFFKFWDRFLAFFTWASVWVWLASLTAFGIRSSFHFILQPSHCVPAQQRIETALS